MSNKPRKYNVKNLNDLLLKGKLNQYFSLDKLSIKNLADAVRKNDVEQMESILSDNITRNGEGISELLDAGYDAQITELSGDLIKEEMDKIEAEAIKSFKSLDAEKIKKQIGEIENLSNISGIKRRNENILKQLRSAELELTIPENVRKVALEFLKEKGKDQTQVKTTKVIQEWGRNKKRALVVWGSKGILAVEYLEKPVEKIKKPKLKYVPTKEEFRDKKPEEILSRKGKFFTLKEKNFVNARKRKTEDQVIEDYFRIFGKVRTKTEIKKLIKSK